MQLLPVSGATLPISLILLSDKHLPVLQGRKGHKQMCGNICTMWALLCPSYTWWTYTRLWSISLHGLDQGREGNAWKAVGSLLRFLFIEWLTLGAGAALEGAGSAGSWEPEGSAAGYPGVA